MELLVDKAPEIKEGGRELIDQAFMVGILSLMPTLTSVSMDEVLAQLPAQLSAGYDAAVDLVRAPQKSRGVLHAAVGERRADGGTRYAHAVDHDAGHRFDRESVADAGFPEHRKVAAAFGAKAKIVANDEVSCTQAADQQAFDEFLCFQMGEGGVEAADAGQRDAFLGKHLEFLAQRGQPRRCRLRREELARVRFERQGSRQ